LVTLGRSIRRTASCDPRAVGIEKNFVAAAGREPSYVKAYGGRAARCSAAKERPPEQGTTLPGGPGS